MNLITSLVWFIIFLFQANGHHGHRQHGFNLAGRLASSYNNRNNPEQIHISLGSLPYDIVMMWSTKEEETFYVEYGNDPKTLTRAKGAISELKIDSEQAARFLHRAELLGLKPGARYSYRIINGNSTVKSETLTFEVPHNDSAKSHSFLIVADMGMLTKALQFLIHEAVNGEYEVVFHVGDIAYNLNSEGGSLGDHYMNRVAKFTSHVPYMTTPGDHERFRSFYHYRYRFSMPNSPWPMKEENLWYSIDIGHTHFISINTEYFLPESEYKSHQLQWLRQDLKAANKKRKSSPWIIVMGHKPIYCTKSVMEQECHKENSAIREELEDLFFEQGVDLYISGHKHSYERSWPMYLSRTFQTNYFNPMAPVYIINGAMGYEYLFDEQKSSPYWLAFSVSDKRKELFARLNVINETHLVWTVHAASTNEEVDYVQIIQKNHGSFGKPGVAALDKIKPRTNRQDLPPEPFHIVDVESQSYQSRRLILFSAVFSLSFILFLFLRSHKVRKVLHL
ncbi:unnamed protein product [Lymnaea stagnalis]|uniref:Purple acid phosphatase n=1 Tax=Lymnaea stagnalis TaxID=6523 RepID=A0AAV2H078_LYMST